MGKNCISKVRDSALPKDIPSKQLKFFRIQTSLTQVWHNLGNDLKTFFQNGTVTTQNYAVPPHSTSPIMSATQPPPLPKPRDGQASSPPPLSPLSPASPPPFDAPRREWGGGGRGKGRPMKRSSRERRKGGKRYSWTMINYEKNPFFSFPARCWAGSVPTFHLPPRAIIESGGGSPLF